MSLHPRNILANMTPEELHLAYEYISGVLDTQYDSVNISNSELVEQTVAYDDHQKNEAQTILSAIELEAMQRYETTPNNEKIYSIIGKHAVRNFCAKNRLEAEPLCF